MKKIKKDFPLFHRSSFFFKLCQKWGNGKVNFFSLSQTTALSAGWRCWGTVYLPQIFMRKCTNATVQKPKLWSSCCFPPILFLPWSVFLTSHNSVFNLLFLTFCLIWSMLSTSLYLLLFSWYRKVAGSIPLVCMLKCPWVKILNHAPDMLVGTLHGIHRHQCINVWINYCESLWTEASPKCPQCKCKYTSDMTQTWLQKNVSLCLQDVWMTG